MSHCTLAHSELRDTLLRLLRNSQSSKSHCTLQSARTAARGPIELSVEHRCPGATGSEERRNTWTGGPSSAREKGGMTRMTSHSLASVAGLGSGRAVPSGCRI